MVWNHLKVFGKNGTRYIQEAHRWLGDPAAAPFPWEVVRFDGARVMTLRDGLPERLDADYPDYGIANSGSGINVIEDLNTVLNMRLADFLLAIMTNGRHEMRQPESELMPMVPQRAKVMGPGALRNGKSNASIGDRVMGQMPERPGHARNLRQMIASMAKGQGTVLIPKADLVNLDEEQWTSLYEALYRLSGIRCVVYGEGDESNPILQFRLTQLGSGKLKDKVVYGGPSEADALKHAVPNRQAVFISIEGLDEETVKVIGSSELVKAVKLKKDYDLPWLAALYAVSNGQLQGIAVIDKFYLEDSSGWYRAEIREYMANQVVAWAA
jgi:hypothetical protein